MSEQIQIINSKTVKARFITILAIILTLIFAWFAVRNQIGDMLADLTSPGDPNVQAAAAAAKGFAPNDPLANWLAASVGKNEDAIPAFEQVVRLAPYDFRWRVELARAYEQAGETEKAEQSFKRAVELAPAYAYPRWQAGNFYLRQNRGDEAFAELKKASVNNDLYPEQVFAIAWDYYNQNIGKINEIAGDSLDAKKGLIKFYINKNRPADALDVFNTISAADKIADPVFSKFITEISFQKRFFRASQEFARQSGIDAESKNGAITNGGFEREIVEPDATYFNWKLVSSEKLGIKTDATQKHEGNRSLRVVFSGFADAYTGNVRQFAAVEPSGKYHLSFWVRTENLKSAGLPNVEIINADDDKSIAVSKSFPGGSNDWQQVEIDFAAPENCEGVTVKIGRAYCGEQCTIYGTIWLDDFKLAKN